MFEFRVTKYAPSGRNPVGVFMRHEWTAFSDIGKEFSGVVLTEDVYRQVENTYVDVAVSFMREAGVSSLEVRGLENQLGAQFTFSDGSRLSLVDADAVVRHVLREEYWCRLENVESFIHIGRDYYMYVGVPTPCPKSEELARQIGLFIEPLLSPYREPRNT